MTTPNNTVAGLAEKWGLWFAWRPVYTTDRGWRFLCFVRRTWVQDYSQPLAPSPAHWEYRYETE